MACAIVWLMLVILAALIFVPAGWRELIMIAAALLAYFWTPGPIYRGIDFTFAPIKELGWLFLGIFGTMVPVLEYMERHAGDLWAANRPAIFLVQRHPLRPAR